MPTKDTPAAILIWDALKRKLPKEDDRLLSVDAFTLHKDAFVRVSDDEVVSDVPFLAYEYNQMTNDETLDFSFYFFKGGFTLNIGPAQLEVGYPQYAYSANEAIAGKIEENDDFSEDIVAENIITTIKLLLNGQIAAGCSWKSGALVAAEIFIIGYEVKPYPILLIKNFSFTNQKATDYTVKQNKVLSEQVKITDAFPLIPPIVNGKRVRRGREVDSIHDLEPLTKKQAVKLEDSFVFHESLGANPDGTIVTSMYASIYFWVTATIIAAGLSYLHFSDTTPEFFHSTLVFIILVLAARYVISFIAAYLLGLRQVRINKGEHPLTYRIEQSIKQKFTKKK
jgi:hypothetical protein